MSLDTLELGREAFRRHDWPKAVETLRSADGDSGLSAGDLERLAEAEWWVGHSEAATDAYEPAFARHLDAAQPTLAATAAMRLAYLHFRSLAGPVGAAWLTRAEELLASEAESAAHAWLHAFRMVMASWRVGSTMLGGTRIWRWRWPSGTPTPTPTRTR